MNTKSKQIHYVMFPVSRLTIVISNLVVIVVFFVGIVYPPSTPLVILLHYATRLLFIVIAELRYFIF